MDRKWWLVIAGCITHAVNTGFCYFGLSAFFPSFEREFGWSRTAISGAFSLARLESGILGPIEGYIVDRVGPQRIMYIGIIVCVGGFFSLSFVNSLPMLYLAIVLGIVLGSSLGYLVPISVLIAKAFREKRSLAFGIFRTGPGISGALMPLIGSMIVAWGWRAAAMTSAAILLVVGLPMAWFINRIFRQHESAQLIASEKIGHGSIAEHNSEEPQYTLREALRTRLFWLFSIAMAFRHLVTEGVSVHFVILLVDRGWSTEAASGLLGLSAVIGAPARLLMGWLGDILDKRHLAIGLLAALSGSVLVMGWSAQAFLFTACMVIYSLAYGGLAALQEPIRADYFGTKAFATIRRCQSVGHNRGHFTGPSTARASSMTLRKATPWPSRSSR